MDIRLLSQDVYYACLNEHPYSSIQHFNIHLSRAIVRLNYGNRPWAHYPMVKDIKHRDMIFIHVPKCAGTSVANSLGFDNIRHYPASVFFLNNKKNFLDSIFFAVVRNPLDRLASILMHFKSSRFSTKKEKELFSEIGVTEDNLNNYIMRMMEKKLFRRRLFLGTKAGRNGFSVAQNDYIFLKGKLLVKNLFSLNQLGQLENWLSQRLGKKIQFPHNNSSNRKKDLNYNDNLVNASRKWLRKDFLLYQMLSDAGGVILEGDSAIKKIEKVIQEDA